LGKAQASWLTAESVDNNTNNNSQQFSGRLSIKLEWKETLGNSMNDFFFSNFHQEKDQVFCLLAKLLVERFQIWIVKCTENYPFQGSLSFCCQIQFDLYKMNVKMLLDHLKSNHVVTFSILKTVLSLLFLMALLFQEKRRRSKKD